MTARVAAAPSTTRVIADVADWQIALADFRGPQLVVGGPGTGKTEFLVRRALHLVESAAVSPTAVTILGFSRRGVAELTDRIRAGAAGALGPLDIATFHSYAARLLEIDPEAAGWAINPQLLTGPEQVALIERLLRAEDPAAWSTAFAPLLGSKTFAREVTDLILRAAEQMHSPTSLAALERSDWRGLPEFLARYRQTLRRIGKVDYGTLIATAVELVAAQSVRSGPLTEAFLLVDEYQDTTPAQVRLLRALQTNGCHITAAADPYQSIYSFRGASVENVAGFEADLGGTDRVPTRIVLSTSFRTPAAILDAAVAVTSTRLPGATGVVVPAAGRGSVEAYLFDQQVEEAEWIAGEVQRLHLVEGMPFGAIGVFVRSKRRLLAELSRALDRRHIPHDLPGSRLSDQPAVRLLLDLVAAATGCDGQPTTNLAMRRVLLGPGVGLTLGALRRLEQQQRVSGSWAASLRSRLPEWSKLADLLIDPSWAETMRAADGLWHVWSNFPDFETMVADPSRFEERAAWRSLTQVIGRWAERNPEGTLVDYRRLAVGEDFEAEPLLSYRRPEADRLVVTTLHQAKGMELDTVFIADAVDGVFPDLRARDSLLGVRHLLADIPTDTAAYRTFRLQEESRLAYTAMTRARRRVVWTATERRLDEGPGRPSRFLNAVAAAAGVTPARPLGRIAINATEAAPEGARLPVTPQEAEATLRRCLGNPAVAAPTRLAALETLASGDRWGLRDPVEFFGVARRGVDTGLIGPNPLVSPSQAALYEMCPRRFALERRLRIGAEGSRHADFGSLIHEVLEVVERGAIAAGDPHAAADTARSELIARFDPVAFGGDPYAPAWLRRAEEFLTRLYEGWPAQDRRGVLVEYPLRATVGGLRWIGRADRIEAGRDGIVIVDYKTSRTPATKSEAATSLQLGFYVLAASRDDRVAGLGSVRGAELWYPLATSSRVARRKFAMDRLDEVETRLTTVATGIAAEDWSPRPGPHCERCLQRAICPAWAEGGARFL